MFIVGITTKHKRTGFQFTPENLMKNIDRLGPWSNFALAEIAIFHYFPKVKQDDDSAKEIDLMSKLCHKYEMYWSDWIIMYHYDVGYKGPFNPDYVNEY